MATRTWHAVVLLFLLARMTRAEVYLIRKETNASTLELTCLYNGPQTESVALGWIFPEAGNLEIEEESNRWRHSSRAGIVKGHFEFYGTIWLSTTSLHIESPNLLPPVMDERWNKFPEVVTTGSGAYSRPVSFTTDRLHISVLAVSDAHIALHTGNSAYSSSSYWIMLDGNGGISSLRKCVHGLPRHLIPRYADCAAHRASLKNSAMLRGGKEWVHFTIDLRMNKTTKQLTIRIDDAEAIGQKTIEWTDAVNPLKEIRYLSFRTQETVGRWKVHDYRLILHSGKDDGEGMNVFQLTEPTRCCLRFHYFMRTNFGGAYVISKNKKENMTLEPTNGEWRMARLEMDMLPPLDHLHVIAPQRTFDLEKDGAVLVLSQPLNICGDDEFFVSRVTAYERHLSNAKCVDLKSKDYAVLRSEINMKTVVAGEGCSVNKFTRSCNITCGLLLDHTCSGKVQCDTDVCTCLPGYKPTQFWNTTCLERTTENGPTQKPDDMPTTPAKSDDFEIDTATEASVDEDPIGPGEEAYIEPAYDEQQTATDEPKNPAITVLAVLCVIQFLVICAFVGKKHLLRCWSTGVQHYDVRWTNPSSGSRQLVNEHEEDS